MNLNSVFDTIGQVAGAASPFLQLGSGIAAAGSQKAAGIYQAGLYELKAIDTLALADIRAEQTEKIGTIQAGRRLIQSKIQARNYMIQGNRVLKNMRATNAALRARAAANGVSLGSGSIAGLQQSNTDEAMFDLTLLDYNALNAKVMGFEDAGAMYISAIRQGLYDKSAAKLQANQFRTAGSFAKKSGGLLADQTLLETGANFLTKADSVFAPFRK
tara:strand:+ start:1096 stop:1743 length:648 start_codon:yes stop_codon:yes gene_type:complete